MGLIHRHCEPFDVDATILRMMSSRRWPRPGYLAPSLMRSAVLAFHRWIVHFMCLRGMGSTLLHNRRLVIEEDEG